ncbi:MAG: hypothetical protein JO189_06120 [Deltaproteobacteria bacterium]|nr:hypothetical protein [Deltaproteobacteria bacterium]
MGAFAPAVFAQAGGAAGGVSAGMPAGSGAANMVNQAPSAGQPGTQAPASAAPIGKASSDYMSSKETNAPQDYSMSKQSTYNEEQARWHETKLERDITAARAAGINVGSAQHQKWLGSIALSKGDRTEAMRHFMRADQDLNDAGFRVSSNNMQYKNSNTYLNGNKADQETNGANLHSNRGTNSAY